MPQPRYKMIMLKLSGEALESGHVHGIDFVTVERICDEIAQARGLGVDIGLVVGGGNIFAAPRES